MQAIKWLTFGISNALTKTVVHFFPSSGNVTAPYPAHCKLSIFGKDLQRKSILVEGARLSQPDGIKMEEAFPQLKSDVSGYFGLEVEISTPQPRIDLSGSSCVIELAARSHSARFWPRCLNGAQSGFHPRSGLVLKDPFNTTSMILVNPSASTVIPLIHIGAGIAVEEDVNADQEKKRQAIKIDPLPADSVVEIALSDLLDEEYPVQVQSWGLVRACAATLSSLKTAQRDSTPVNPSVLAQENAALGEVSCYFLYRDVLTKRPLTVSSL